MAEVMDDRRDNSALWMGWIGIAAGIISFFTMPVLFGIVAIVLGLITAFSKANALGWWAIIIGAAGIIVHWFVTGNIF
ncbi:hypothetical protein [Virgibacillus oceani]|uniref:DUF4190 domain-containing protein n=1 Tax=Virgibacillus oceani TaxID=1479511 RepID=A0A917HBW7_9BACI|nr:hypothetical protein [Virgibacillus oceani]GGG73884.1 hypothetical protein GCM10011398_18020 [Virgibacillus oceani]